MPAVQTSGLPASTAALLPNGDALMYGNHFSCYAAPVLRPLQQYTLVKRFITAKDRAKRRGTRKCSETVMFSGNSSSVESV